MVRVQYQDVYLLIFGLNQGTCLNSSSVVFCFSAADSWDWAVVDVRVDLQTVKTDELRNCVRIWTLLCLIEATSII